MFLFFRDAIFNKTTSMAALIEEKATKIDGKFYFYLMQDQVNYK